MIKIYCEKCHNEIVGETGYDVVIRKSDVGTASRNYCSTECLYAWADDALGKWGGNYDECREALDLIRRMSTDGDIRQDESKNPAFRSTWLLYDEFKRMKRLLVLDRGNSEWVKVDGLPTTQIRSLEQLHINLSWIAGRMERMLNENQSLRELLREVGRQAPESEFSPFEKAFEFLPKEYQGKLMAPTQI